MCNLSYANMYTTDICSNSKMHGDCTDKKRVAELFKWLASAKDEKFD